MTNCTEKRIYCKYLPFYDKDKNEWIMMSGEIVIHSNSDIEAIYFTDKAGTKFDVVTHPQHYTDGKYECIDVMIDTFGVEAVKNFCKLNAFKYLWRSEKKNHDEDIEKAKWYLTKYIELSCIERD